MTIDWLGPCKEHPFEGYAILKEGDGKLTATIPALEWWRADRSLIESRLIDAMKAGLDDRTAEPTVLIGPRYVMASEPTKGHFTCTPIARVKGPSCKSDKCIEKLREPDESELCNHQTKHPDNTHSFCMRTKGHEGKHRPC